MIFFPLFAPNNTKVLLGSSAPQIIAKNQDQEDVVFADVYTRGITLVYFYPKAQTSGCSKQACSLRDAYGTLQSNGLEILGVSRDTPEKQKAFKNHLNLPFMLIADVDAHVAKAFHVSLMPFLGLTHRQSFIIKDGKFVWFSLSPHTNRAAEEVQKALDTLKKQ